MDSVTEYSEPGLEEPRTMPVQSSAEHTQATDGLTQVLTGAVDAARAAIEEYSGDTVGEYLGVSYEDPTAATHRFLANMPGYKGWQWAVVVAAYPGATHATISEVVLVPGPTALLAPEWVPWEQRVRAGDLSPGDLLAPPAQDPRLVPGYLLSGDPEVDEVAAEVGFGRRQVLSAWGREDAGTRWHTGEYGPDSAMARSTKRACRDCGYLVPLSGSLGTMFGVCANEMSADGHVVDIGYGCGAHSDTPAPSGAGSPLYDPYDDGVLDVNANPVPVPVAPAEEAVEVEEATVEEAVEADVAVEVEVEAAAEAPEAEAPEAEKPEVGAPEAEAPEAEAARDVPEPGDVPGPETDQSD